MKSLHKTLDIIEAVAERGAVGVRELSSITGFPSTTIHRIASTLVKRQYLDQNPITKTYSLSLRFLELGTRVEEQFDISAIAGPYLQRLRTETEESANLAILDGDEVVYVQQANSEKSMLKIFTRLGARVPVYATGVGKMFMSQWKEAELESYLQRVDRRAYTPNTLVNRAAIMAELARISNTGFAVDNEEMETGVRCVAALVFDYTGKPVAAVSISGAALRITPERIEYFGERVKQCAEAISSKLGYKPKT